MRALISVWEWEVGEKAINMPGRAKPAPLDFWCSAFLETAQ